MKKILSLILAAVLCLSLLAACASKDADVDDKNLATEPEGEEPSSENEQPAGENREAENEAPEYDEEDIVNINVMLANFGGIQDKTPVEDAINAISEKEIGVHVTLQFVDFGEYTTQLTLGISGGDPIDLAETTPIPGSTLSSLYANGSMMDMTDLLATYGQDVLDTLGSYVDTNKIGGKIYAVPGLIVENHDTYLAMRTDILEELGMTEFAASMKKWEDVEEVFAAVHENTTLYGIGGAGRIMTLNEEFIDALEDAGLRDYVSGIQSQLDAWKNS